MRKIGGGLLFAIPHVIRGRVYEMDDIWYRCLFEAERIVRQGMHRIEPTPSRLGTAYFKVLYFHSPMLNMNFTKRLIWFMDEQEPTFSPQYLVKKIAEQLDYFLRYGGD